MSPTALTDTHRMTDADLIAHASHIIYTQLCAEGFPDGELETLRRIVDELELRYVISPCIAKDVEPTSGAV